MDRVLRRHVGTANFNHINPGPDIRQRLWHAGAEISDYLLASSSAAIGAGVATDAPITDLAGNPRPTSGRYDAGCYQKQ